MAPSITSVLFFILALPMLCSKITSTPTAMMKSEEMAVFQSGWWLQYAKTTLRPCEYPGITCNQFGSVTAISLFSSNNIDGKFGKMNFTLIPNLESLNILDSGLTGTIPSQLCALSKLRHLHLWGNYLLGNIPSCLGNLSMLEYLDLSMNNLNGSIPLQLGSLKSLSYLILDGNEHTGSIPATICRLSQLTTLSLSSNHLSSFVPICLGGLSKLKYVNLSMNKLNGSIPSQLGSLQNVSYLSLYDNKLTGPIPFSIWNMTHLRNMELQENQIDGSIPPQMGNMSCLYYINVSFNRIVGSIPQEFRRLSLKSLDLRNNFLTGPIPNSLYVPFLNLSYNSLSGQIPYSYLYYYNRSVFIGNKDLVYTTSHSKTSYMILYLVEIVLPIVLCFSFLLLLCFGFYCRKRVKPLVSNEHTRKSRDAFSIWNYDGRIAYEDIVEATEDFNLKYCIGTGGYGSVYRAKLPKGKVIALKKLHHLEAEEPAFDKSFRNEVKLLTQIRHKNIIKLHGFCLHRRNMFLMYDYMERGSLFYVLRSDAEAIELNWSKRVKIIIDIAHALSYLHHQCSPSIIHRDLSTNNILLNNEMQAFVSDFGTARFLDPALSNISTIAGTLGYIAPELAYTVNLNEKSDVYSYGVVVMETITEKYPEEVISKLLTSSIKHIKLQDILDPRLPSPHDGSLIAEILQVVSFALACLSLVPKSRPSMKHISETFLSKRIMIFGSNFHDITLGQIQGNHEASL